MEFCIATDREKLCCSFNNRITLQNSLPDAFFLCGLCNCFVFSTVFVVEQSRDAIPERGGEST